MNRYGWVVLRAYAPALTALLIAVLSMFWTSLFGHSAAFNGLASYAKWIPPFALLAALIAGLLSTLRLWHWKNGKTPRCRGCEGPLGRLHHGPQGDYRKCLACGGKQQA